MQRKFDWNTGTVFQLFLLAVLVTAWPQCFAMAQSPPSVSALTIPLVLPSAVVFDANGNLYVAERGAHRVRKIDPTGNLTTVAGNGIQGFAGDSGPAIAASLDSPQGLALGPGPILYIADTHNNRIRAVDLAAGTISTVAGSGSFGFAGDGGPALQAQLASPSVLATAADGTLYFADTGNHRIRSISPAGIISTVAGSSQQGFAGEGQSSTAAALDSPDGLAIDAAGNLYIADTHNQRLRKIDAGTGIIHTIAGDGTSGFSGDAAASTAAQLSLPKGVSLTATGEVYFADSANQRIRRIGVDGTIATLAGNGVQGFSGDGSPGTAAALDTPSSSSVSAGGVTAFADTGNQRVRQLSANSTSQTVAGLGTTMPGVLILSAPSVLSYGSGNIVASLESSSPASGSVTFLAVAASGTSMLGTAPLASNSASLNTGSLNAGSYNILATFSGDSVHAAAESSVIAIAIAPLQLMAIATPVSLVYGQAIPPLTGSVNGMLARDQQGVSVQFLSQATDRSSPGVYPISAVLTGSAALNYIVAATPPGVPLQSVSIQKAPALASLSVTGSIAQAGLPISLAAQVTSTTQGSPTGSVIFFDGAAALATEALPPTGTITFTTTGLSAGAHTLSVSYSGDADFLASSSNASSLLIGGTVTGSGGGVDFSLAATGPSSQTIPGGAAAVYTFAVQAQGSLSSPINLAVAGLPLGATASFSPAYLPPGGPNTFTLTVTTPASAVAASPSALHPLTSAALGLLAVPLFLASLSRRRGLGRLKHLMAAAVVSGVVLLAGCGDRVYTQSKTSSTTQTYTLTVNASATAPSGVALLHSTNVTLIVQ